MTEKNQSQRESSATRTGAAIKAVCKRLLPSLVVHEVQKFRALAGNERPLYLRTRLLNSIGFENLKHSRPPRSARSFLFVCFGNIMRSPMCEALMRRELSAGPEGTFTIRSAGLHAFPSREAHPWAVAAAKDFCISLERHRAQPLTPALVEEADAILLMDYQNLVQYLSRFPQAKSKAFMLSAYAGENYPSVEIADPYYAGEAGTRKCYEILDSCVRNLASSLRSSRNAAS